MVTLQVSSTSRTFTAIARHVSQTEHLDDGFDLIDKYGCFEHGTRIKEQGRIIISTGSYWTEHLTAELALIPSRLDDRFCDGTSECGEAIQDRNVDLKLGGLAIEVSGHDFLADPL